MISFNEWLNIMSGGPAAWTEGTVSTYGLRDAIQKSMKFMVGGKWSFGRVPSLRGRSTRGLGRGWGNSFGIRGSLQNEKTQGNDMFLLECVVSYWGDREHDRMGGTEYDSKSGTISYSDSPWNNKDVERRVEIRCRLHYAHREDGVRVPHDQSVLGVRDELHGHNRSDVGLLAPFGGPLNTPKQVADWVKKIVDDFKGFGDNDGGGGGGDDEPEWSPSSGPAKLVGV